MNATSRLQSRAPALARRSLPLRRACSLLVGCSCAFPEPWVKPYERERLADPIMQLQRQSLVAKHNEHVREVREGSRGANGVQGGGCGCN